MKTVRVVAIKDHDWAARKRKAGESYDVDSEDIRFDALLKLGLARVEESVAPSPAYNRRDMRAHK